MPTKKKKKKVASSSESIVIRKPRGLSGRSSSGSSASSKKSTQEKPKGQRVLSPKQLKRSLDPLRDQLSVLVNQANERVQNLLIAGKPSRALEDARRTWERMTSRREDDELFKSELKTRREINREFARVHSFLNDYTSTLQGADDLITNLSNLSGQFGSNWNNAGLGKNYNTDLIDDEKAKKSFEIYRRVLETAGGWERAVGIIKGKESLIGYGSENLIANIYDMVDNNYFEGDIMNIALEQVEAGLRAYEQMAAKQVSDYDYGIVFDDETAIERRNFYTWRKRNKRG